MVIHFSPNFAMNLKIHFLKSLFLDFLRTIQASIMKEHRTESGDLDLNVDCHFQMCNLKLV